jgi:phenylacetate-CoA ligase
MKASTPAAKLLTQLKHKPESYWQKRGETHALRLFHAMAVRVPAYGDFLKKHHVDHKKIKSIQDFSHVPPISKDSYLRAYPRESVYWDGVFSDKPWIISTTSGSTGEPFYFPRQEKQNEQYALTAELYLRTNFQIHKKKTLYIIGFPMGAWIGGVFTLQALELIQKRGTYALSIISPGINKVEIIKAIKNLGPHFDQVLIGSYGPFLKDTLDEGTRMGINWKKYKLGFIFSAEGFSETFRDYIIESAKLTNPYTTTLNHYGTVDMGTMSYETPLAILLRRMGTTDPGVYQALFGQVHKLPTLTQYIPEHFYFESVNNNLYCTADSGIPLVRYDLKDHGGVIPLTPLTSRVPKLASHIQKARISDTIWSLPFVYVYERSDFSVSFFAFQIYPETIRKALQQRAFAPMITGKFTMMVTFDTKASQQLEIHIETMPNARIPQSIKTQIQKTIIQYLLAENSEYRRTREEFADQTTPRLIFWPYADPTYFSGKGKQQWVKK